MNPSRVWSPHPCVATSHYCHWKAFEVNVFTKVESNSLVVIRQREPIEILFNLSSPYPDSQGKSLISSHFLIFYKKMKGQDTRCMITRLRAFSRSLSEWYLVFPFDHLNKNWIWVFIFRWLVYIEDDLFSDKVISWSQLLPVIYRAYKTRTAKSYSAINHSMTHSIG